MFVCRYIFHAWYTCMMHAADSSIRVCARVCAYECVRARGAACP